MNSEIERLTRNMNYLQNSEKMILIVLDELKFIEERRMIKHKNRTRKNYQDNIKI